MPKGGARPGAGRPRDLAKAAGQLDKIREEMQKGFYEAAWELARKQPELVREAIKYAMAGDKLLLKFCIEQFNKIVGALPEQEQSAYKVYHERLLQAVERSLTPVDSSSRGDAQHPGLAARGGDEDAVLLSDTHQAGDGRRAER